MNEHDDNNNKGEEEDEKEAPPPCSVCTTCTTQDSYRLAVLLSQKGPSAPPSCVMFPVQVFEKDGMARSFYSDLRNMLILMISFVYQPPYIVETVPVVMSSGSTVHASSIGSEVFALEHCSGPCFLPDKENVLRYKGEFFRRATNQFEATETAAYRTTCTTLERNMPVDDYTYSSL